MKRPDDPMREIAALRERLSRLSEASLRITEDLDLDAVLQGVLDGARSLTGARMDGISRSARDARPQDTGEDTESRCPPPAQLCMRPFLRFRLCGRRPIRPNYAALFAFRANRRLRRSG